MRFFFCGWEPIIGHADHDGGIRLARFGPVVEKKRDKVRWILRSVSLYMYSARYPPVPHIDVITPETLEPRFAKTRHKLLGQTT